MFRIVFHDSCLTKRERRKTQHKSRKMIILIENNISISNKACLLEKNKNYRLFSCSGVPQFSV